MILPGKTLGVLGGGQLGRFFTMAAHSLGYRVVVLDPDPLSPAGGIADLHLEAAYSNKQVLAAMAADCDVITTEFENIPAETLEYLATKTMVHPSAGAVKYAQNRMREKALINELGIKTVPYVELHDKFDVKTKANEIRFPAILKTAEFGYDGKGQTRVESLEELEMAFNNMSVPCVLEEMQELEKELSVILARNVYNEVACFPIAENVHINSILHTSAAPAIIDDFMHEEAIGIAKEIAKALDYVGVMAVELFVTSDKQLLVNEIAPRTHNSGHFTMDATLTSQFEQQVRAICGLPLGSTRMLSPVVMTNILGDIWGKTQPNWQACLQNQDTSLYLYGKQAAKTGRKMGHFNLLGEQPEAINVAETTLESMQSRD